MKNIFANALLMVFLLMNLSPLFAENEPNSVYDKVNRVNTFNKLTDAWATRGKSEPERTQILEKRQEERRINRIKARQLKKQRLARKRERQQTEQNKKFKGWRQGTDQN